MTKNCIICSAADPQMENGMCAPCYLGSKENRWERNRLWREGAIFAALALYIYGMSHLL